jgi:succinate dehydrogenase / fumarate reductase cytochrome b subunit
MQATTTEARPATAPGLTSIGAKAIMAFTGAGLTLFVIGHMVGNLQVFLGPEALNKYAAFLKSVPELLWAVRIGLLVLFVAHIYVAFWLTAGNRAARPVPYVFQATRQASIASRTMMYSGALLLAFVIFHLAHYTFGWLYPEYLTFHDPKDRHDVYRMTVEGFRVWWVSLAYIVSMLLLGLHLSHGISSLFRTLGVGNPRHMRCIRATGFSLAMILMVGNIAMPLAVLLRIVRLPGE